MKKNERIVLLEWLANGETGSSSQAMAFASLGVVMRRFGMVPYPLDPGDLGRCLGLLDFAPWALGDAEPLLREHSVPWRILLDEWEKLVAMYRAECAANRNGPGPLMGKTYKRMRELNDGIFSKTSAHDTEKDG